MSSLRKLKEKIDYKFLIVLAIGILLRIITFIYIAQPNDSKGYFADAKTFLALDYYAVRGPSYPMVIALFILIFGDNLITVKIVSFTFGVLTIFISYFCL